MLNREQRRQQRMMKTRLGQLACFITVAISIYIIRLGWLQLLFVHNQVERGGHTVLQRSIIQRERGIVLDNGRSSIVDRLGRAYTGQTVMVPVLFPVHKHALHADVVRTLALWLHVPEREVTRRWEQLSEPYIWPAEQDAKLPFVLNEEQVALLQASAWNGIRALPYSIRYPLKEHTPQWVGAMAKQVKLSTKLNVKEGTINSAQHIIGVSGLERSFDPLLRGIGPTTFIHYTDAAQRPLYGLDVRIRRPDSRYYPLRLITTTDQSIELAISHILDRNRVTKGSVVVLDAATRDVVAMVCRPTANPYHIEPEQASWNNRATRAISPGSVYKLFIAAAALEAGKARVNEPFHCNGHYGKYNLACWSPGGHGALTMREAFAQSCNVVFAELGERLGVKSLSEYAERMGVSGTIGRVSDDGIGHQSLYHFEGEEKSRIFITGEQLADIDSGECSQVGIGQRNVRLTPLAAANFVVTLLQDGVIESPALVRKIQYATGMPLAHFNSRRKGKRVMGLETARHVRQMMREVVQYGTGQPLQRAVWSVAGKSGTAQAAAYGTTRIHTWFVGYGPSDKPQYVVSVASEDEASNTSHKATEVFRKVIDVLAMYRL